MVTYFYWLAVIGLAGLFLWSLGFKAGQWRGAFIASGVVLVVALGAYFFYFENLFVKRFGGVMSIKTPAGQQHITTTWKDDNLWVETYDPATNRCIFAEYSRGNMLEGRVVIKHCNPLQR